MILNRYRRGVPFYNALFIHQRQVCVDRTYLGYHATALVLWEKGNDGMEVGLVDRRILKFQFLNTRKHETVWPQSFSEETGCSFSALRPPSPKPGGGGKPITVMKEILSKALTWMFFSLPPVQQNLTFQSKRWLTLTNSVKDMALSPSWSASWMVLSAMLPSCSSEIFTPTIMRRTCRTKSQELQKTESQGGSSTKTKDNATPIFFSYDVLKYNSQKAETVFSHLDHSK